MKTCEVIINPDGEGSFHWDFDEEYRQNVAPPECLCGLPAVDSAEDDLFGNFDKIPMCAMHADMWHDEDEEQPAAKIARKHFFGKN